MSGGPSKFEPTALRRWEAWSPERRRAFAELIRAAIPEDQRLADHAETIELAWWESRA